MAKKAVQPKWYHERRWAAVICTVALLASYGVASLAIDSGSLTQYFIAIALLILSINRLAHIVILSTKKVRAQKSGN